MATRKKEINTEFKKLAAKKAAAKKAARPKAAGNRVAYRLRSAAHRLETAAQNIRAAATMLDKGTPTDGGTFRGLMKIAAIDTMNAAEYLEEQKYLNKR